MITASLNLPGGVAVTTSSSQLLVSDRGELDVFASPFTGSPAQTALSGISQSIALDASDDAILGLQNSTVMYAAPNYTSATTINGSVGGAVRVDSSGTLFLADGSGGQVLVYAAPYTGSPTSLTVPSEGGTMIPGTLSEDGSGNLWVEAAPAGGCSSCNYYLFEYTTPFAANQTPALAVNLGSYGYVGPAATQSGYGIDLTGSNTLSVINSSGSTIGTITNGITSPWTMLYVR